MDNLIICWIAIGYRNVSPCTCPAHLQTAAGVPCAKPFREFRAAQQLSWHQCWFARGCPSVSPCTCPVLATGGHHGTKPAGVSWVALHLTVIYVQGSPTDFPALQRYFVDWVLSRSMLVYLVNVRVYCCIIWELQKTDRILRDSGI